ncbi:unnamed protein product [Parnassius apollo]|uniref:(apollo) hypothetical protein n=1 Tax=Parnassius apollo TaxID=110799 RepID=A0A8S3Y0Q9_PARAO|nr:unnamed protein product [Parnassius apollo]
MHRLFSEPSITITEQNMADRVRYILRSNIFDVAKLKRLRRETVLSLDENLRLWSHWMKMLRYVVDSNDDESVAQKLELEQTSPFKEAIVQKSSTFLENRLRFPLHNKRNWAVVRASSPVLVNYSDSSRDLCDTDSILFDAALAVCRIIGVKLSGCATEQSSAIPARRITIEECITNTWALIGSLICFRSGNNRPRIELSERLLGQMTL